MRTTLLTCLLLLLAACGDGGSNPIACHAPGDVCEVRYVVLYTDAEETVLAFGDTLTDFAYFGPFLSQRNGEWVTTYEAAWTECSPLCE